MKPRILLTGATGFVGRNLLKSLSKYGVDVDVVVRGGHKNDFSSNPLISNVIETSNLFEHDSDWWASLCEGYSKVIHLAWYVEPGCYLHSNENIECLIGSLSLAQGARKAGVKRFIGVGTCLEYELKNEVLSVDKTPLRPKTLYGASKLSLFTTISQLFNTHEYNFLWLRLFFLLPNNSDEIVYGDNQRLGDYIKSKISRNEPVFLTSGTQIRDYLYIEEAADMMAKAIFHDKTGALNICSGVPRTVREVAEEIAIGLGRPELLNFGSKVQQEKEHEYIVGERDVFFNPSISLKKLELVSICIPVRNGESFITDAIKSCLNQTYKNYEILIIDNGSTDATVDIIKSFASDKIKLIKNSRDIGITANFNACIENASGNYIKFLCADDILDPSCIEKMLLRFQIYPRASLIIAQRNIINKNNIITGILKFPSSLDEVSGHEVINKCLFSANLIGEPTAVMFRKSHALRGFSIKYRHLLDLEMWFHLLEKGTLVNIKEPLCFIRRHDQQMTLTSIKTGALVKDNKRLLNEYLDKNYIKKTILNQFKWKIIYIYRYIRYKRLQKKDS